jgi:hypothetical protein
MLMKGYPLDSGSPNILWLAPLNSAMNRGLTGLT